MAKAPSPAMPGRIRGRMLVLILFLLLLYLVVPSFGNFSASLSVVRDARIELVAAALVLVLVTYGFAAGVYQSLALRLRGVEYRHTLLVQLATAFTNRLLPAGLGGLTVNVQYLRKHGHKLSEAIAIAGLNNLLGAIGHLLLFGIVVAANPDAVTGRLTLSEVPHFRLVVLAVILVLAVNLVLFGRLRHSVRKGFKEALVYVAAYRRHPEKLAAALLCSVALTSCYVLVFYLCVQSVGIGLSLWSIFAVFTVGVLAGAVTPTPGGLGGTEAGLVAGLVAYGVDVSTALAGVLLYRFITYWLPLLAGFGVFIAIRRRYL